MNRSQSVIRLALAGARQFQTSGALKAGAVQPQFDNSHIPKLREIQMKFQAPNDIPVYLKGGPMDKVLFYITMSLCIVGLGMGGEFMYQCYYPPQE